MCVAAGSTDGPGRHVPRLCGSAPVPRVLSSIMSQHSVVTQRHFMVGIDDSLENLKFFRRKKNA